MENFIEHEGPVAVALEVIPTKIFHKWLSALESDLDLDPTDYSVLTSETNIYLLSLDSYEDQIEDYLPDHFESIFKSELETWSLDVDKWPENRSYEEFNKWFDFKPHNLINMLAVE